ncbi:MAG: type II toxin-antitoxin system HicB family antitoxin [Lachnospiraceae bacterium]|jgi:antitoxin HicB|nr:type II toxin-antitoxin system HicB family antitoxin [Lachnospiraceae bacterium]
MAKYIYPAIFTPEANGQFSICFPDIENCFTCGDSLEDGINMAEDVLSLMLTHFEDEGRIIPNASAINDLTTENNAFATYITCDTTAYRRLMNNTAVKKTLTIPSWLNDSAIAAGLNFSQVLQDALKQQLNVT